MDTFCTGRLSLPPGVNASYRNVRIETAGKIYNRIASTQALKDFKERGGWELKQAEVNWSTVDHIQTCRRARQQHIPLEFSLTFYYPTLWKNDIDAGIKAAQDAVFLHLGLNDNLVCRLIVDKKVDPRDPRVEFAITIKDSLWQQ